MFTLDDRQTVILAILVLFLGRFLNKRLRFLERYNIPQPVSGGVVASLVFTGLYLGFDFSLEFSLAQRDMLLIVFFTCIGLSARFATLWQGGKALLILLGLAVGYLVIQNVTGVSVAILSGLEASTGLLGGSVALSGGHGTAIAWAPTFVEQYGIHNAMEIAVACATFGLVLGGIIGGPLAQHLIQRHQLQPEQHSSLSVGVQDEKQEKITADAVFNALLVISIAVGIGLHLHKLLEHLGLKLPVFVSCIFGGIVLSNTIPYMFKRLPWPTGTPSLALVSDISLGLFLSMSLMSLQLWTLVDLAIPILLILSAQLVVILSFARWVVFPLLGSNYSSAVMASGYAGLALGATPTAIANMTAVTQRYGAAPQAFIVIPLIGAFFIDIANAIIIQNFLTWLQ